MPVNINQIPGINNPEAERLATNKIETTDQLWREAYEFRDSKFQELVDKLGVPTSTVAALLIADACDEAHPKSSWRIVNLWNWAKRVWRRRWGHWLDLALVVVPLALLVLAILSLPVKWRKTVVASRRITEGSTIKPEDVQRALRLTRPNAVSTTEQVIGRKVLRNIDRDEAVLVEMVVPNPIEQTQVIISASSGIPAFARIRLQDVELRRVPLEPGTFVATSDVIGRYSLEPIPAGSTLHANQLSGFRIGQDELENKSVLSVPIKEGYFSPAVAAGNRVNLLFAPHDKTLSPPAPIENVLILNLTHRGDVWSMVVAVRQSDQQNLLKWLPLSDLLASPASRR